MKGHKMHHAGRKHRNTGGVNEAEMDLREHPEARTNAKEIDYEAEERKHGGHVKRTKRKHGGHVMKHEGMGPEHEATGGRAKRKRGGHVVHHHTGHVKHVGAVHGEHGAHHAGRKPRKSGGRATSDNNPFTSAAKGTAAKGRKLDMEMDGGPGEE
jgi:hypothetical protein